MLAGSDFAIAPIGYQPNGKVQDWPATRQRELLAFRAFANRELKIAAQL
jgi:hypothetical protein